MLLVTWWMWFIWSHTVVELLCEWIEVIILDNLSNSRVTVLDAIKQITQKEPRFVHGDISDKKLLRYIFDTYPIAWVIHFAAKKAVGESCTDPRLYYKENIEGMITLTQIMHEKWCAKIVFSSSCTVYDPLQSIAPFAEDAPTGNNFSPYGTTKYVNEMILRDLSLHQWFWAVNLRYFNPIGAHHSWLIGEDPAQPPTNLLPVVFQVVTWVRARLDIYGDEYATSDGTCLRDYIHVVDLAKAHIAAWKWLSIQTLPVDEVFNLWTGTPTSVKELVAIVEKVTTQSINTRIVAPRPWDVPVAYAVPNKAKSILWRKSVLTVEDAVRDSWQYVQKSVI